MLSIYTDSCEPHMHLKSTCRTKPSSCGATISQTEEWDRHHQSSFWVIAGTRDRPCEWLEMELKEPASQGEPLVPSCPLTLNVTILILKPSSQCPLLPQIHQDHSRTFDLLPLHPSLCRPQIPAQDLAASGKCWKGWCPQSSLAICSFSKTRFSSGWI